MKEYRGILMKFSAVYGKFIKSKEIQIKGNLFCIKFLKYLDI